VVGSLKIVRKITLLRGEECLCQAWKWGPSATGTRAGVGIVLQKRLASNNDQATAAVGYLLLIDTARIARDFKIEAAARDRGRHNLPGTHDTNLDALEQKIIQKMEGEWAQQGDELLNSLRDYAARLVSYSIPGEYLRLQIQAEHVLAWLRVATGQALRDLTCLQERYLSARDELRRFRNRNSLCRPVQQPAHRWRAIGLLFVFAVVEAVFIASPFAKGTEVGFIDGLCTAVVVSLTNVVLSFLLGLGPARWRNHRDRVISTSGVLITIAGIAIIGTLHLFVAHLCLAASLVVNDGPFAVVSKNIQEALTDITSMYIVVVGLIFALAAIWKGSSFDDPYPLYGATYRRERSALRKYANAHFALLGELGEVIEDTVVQLSDGVLRLPQLRQMAIDVRATRAARLNSFRAYETSVETATNQLFKLYRDINHAQRTTAPPSYFDEKWQLPHSFLLSPELKSLLADPETGDVAASVAELERLKKSIVARHELLNERYPHLLETD
jgi:hypothetical protein